jgi:glycosyltransferase involved in cell wall biosynthesis
VLIDNASSDDTAKTALSCWVDGPAPLRVVRESKLGLQGARERGLKESKYDLLGFVDDDNWIAPDWVLVANEILANDLSLGAVGSICEPVFEIQEPKWFNDFHSSYAILTDADLNQCKGPPEYLNGAGLCVRKEAWTQLIQEGFRSVVTDRVGARLSGGGDTELTLAIRLAGWKIRVEPRLRLQHFMPAQRLRWEYLRRLQRGYGASQVLLDAYTEHSLSLKFGPRSWLSDLWWYQLWKSVRRIASQPRTAMAALSSDGGRRNQVVEIEEQFGRARGLLQLRGRYGRIRREVRKSWRRLPLSDPYFSLVYAESRRRPRSKIDQCF